MFVRLRKALEASAFVMRFGVSDAEAQLSLVNALLDENTELQKRLMAMSDRAFEAEKNLATAVTENTTAWLECGIARQERDRMLEDAEARKTYTDKHIAVMYSNGAVAGERNDPCRDGASYPWKLGHMYGQKTRQLKITLAELDTERGREGFDYTAVRAAYAEGRKMYHDGKDEPTPSTLWNTLKQIGWLVASGAKVPV